MRGEEDEGREDEKDRECVGDSRPARGQGEVLGDNGAGACLCV